nr:ATP-binding protein [Tumebacillus flagellatus]
MEKVFENLQDGILIMNQDREILVMNPSASRMTGWKIGQRVPYCKFCQTRVCEEGEEPCYLVAKREVPYFLSSMPTYEGTYIDVEMSTAIIYESEKEGQQEILLVLKDMTLKKKEEEARFTKLSLQKTLQAQESEHKRLAQELHDGIGQSLYSVSLGVQAIQKHLEQLDQEGTFKSYCAELSQVIDQAIQDIKIYTTQLRPTGLDQLGLVAAVTTMLQTLQSANTDIAFEFKHDYNLPLSQMICLNVYRVIQEAVHNALKYAEAKCVCVTIGQKTDDRLLTLQIQDDGRGFDLGKAREGLGLKHMEERVHQVQGQMRIQTQKGYGTEIFVEIPVPEEEGESRDQV